jgi:hypothetical protein
MSKEDVDNAKPSNASSGWFCNYMKKYNFDSIKMRGEAASAVAAEEFVKEPQYLTEKGSYSPKFIFSFNETAVSGKRCLLGLNISQEEKSDPRFKVAKDLFCL